MLQAFLQLEHGAYALIAVAFFLGGVLKGATGVGTPLLVMPLLVTVYDVRYAIALFVFPNLLPNVWQAWRFRSTYHNRSMAVIFALSGACGSALGLALLTVVPNQWLKGLVAFSIFSYIGLRVIRPGIAVPANSAKLLSVPFGFAGGALQSSAGIGAPVSLSFSSALRLPREQFIPLISTFLACVGLVQIAVLSFTGVFTVHTASLSMLAMLPLSLGMSTGGRLGELLSQQSFERIILFILFCLAIRLIWTAS